MSEQIKALVTQLTPEIILVATACFLLLLGCSAREAARRLAPVVALIAVGTAFIIQIPRHDWFFTDDTWHQITLNPLSHFFRLIALGVSLPLILLAWPTNDDATAGKGIDFGKDVPEFFSLMLLAIAGILLVTAANDIILLFLGIELASIPTYIMVSTSRPIPVAQEAGVKYFFLGAMAAAVMLFGLSYLYGTTGSIRLDVIAKSFTPGGVPTSFQLLALLMLIAGFAFKIAAVPMHAYVGDVYQGAATPVTAFLAFVPKTTGFVALIKILWVAGGNSWAVPAQIVTLIVVLAAVTMTVGNVLGLLQSNIKRVLAYSSIAHTGYMLVGVSSLLKAGNETLQAQALSGVLFYLTAYGIMNAGAFGVLMLLPSRNPKPATTAETFDDIAGLGRHHVLLGLAMAICCFSLTGMPLTIGFLGKYFLLEPALSAPGLKWLAILLMVNAAISAAYYLRIVGTMFLKSDAPGVETEEPARVSIPAPIAVAIALSVVGTVLLGVYFKGVTQLHDFAKDAVPASVSTVSVTR
jgi:NADH-quinone oxidoreductase subunit N